MSYVAICDNKSARKPLHILADLFRLIKRRASIMARLQPGAMGRSDVKAAARRSAVPFGQPVTPFPRSTADGGRQDEEASLANDITHPRACNDRFQDWASDRVITESGWILTVASFRTRATLTCYTVVAGASVRLCRSTTLLKIWLEVWVQQMMRKKTGGTRDSGDIVDADIPFSGLTLA